MKLEFKKIGNLHKRWLTNITLVIVAVGVVCVAAITASYAAYCYKNMDADLQNRARTTTDYFKEAIGQDYDTFYQSCITYAETFDQADALELQFIDQYGKIVASSYGTWAATSPRTPEVQEAISTRTIQPFVGKDPDTGERIRLTQVEYAILKLFMQNPGRALSREDILSAVWGKDYEGELKIVDVNIRRLRLKIEDNATNPTYITTIWGFGYKWGL